MTRRSVWACALVCLATLGWPSFVRAQDVSSAASAGGGGAAAPAPAPLGTWAKRLWDGLELRQNTNVKKDIAKPAHFTITAPKDAEKIYQVGVGLLVPLHSGTSFDVDGLADYQKDNTTDEEQDALKAGITGEWRFARRGMSDSSLLFRSDFMNDAVEESQTLQLAAGYTEIFRGRRAFPHPNLPYRVPGDWLEIVYFPFIGVEVDTVLRAADPLEEGNVVRGVGQLSLALYPAPVPLEQRIESIISFAYREDFRDTTNATDDSHPFFTFELNAYLIKQKRGEAGVGLSYKRGEDPDDGLEAADSWEIAFKVRVK